MICSCKSAEADCGITYDSKQLSALASSAYDTGWGYGYRCSSVQSITDEMTPTCM